MSMHPQVNQRQIFKPIRDLRDECFGGFVTVYDAQTKIILYIQDQYGNIVKDYRPAKKSPARCINGAVR